LSGRIILRSETLVQGRECGFCTVCCSATKIDAPEFKKPAGILCQHCNGRGCTIHDTRPRVCRDFFCGWWVLPQLDEDWRPDKSGVLILPRTENLPDGYASREGFQLFVLGEDASIRRPGFVELVMGFVASRIAVYLLVAGPPGQAAISEFLNERLAGYVAAPNRSAVLSLLLESYRQMKVEAARVHGGQS